MPQVVDKIVNIFYRAVHKPGIVPIFAGLKFSNIEL
jgi:hypothetical protein